MEAVGQAGEIDVVADRDNGQDPVPGGRLGEVGVDVDDNQAGRAAGDADAELRVGAPPPGDMALVEGGGVESVAPASCGQARALGGRVRSRAALGAVGGRGLAAGGPGGARASRGVRTSWRWPGRQRRDSEAGCRESLLEVRRSAGMRTPYQRPKRLNDGRSLANVAREDVEHVRRNPEAVSMMRPVGKWSDPAQKAATQRHSVAVTPVRRKLQVRHYARLRAATEATQAPYM